ncbi:MAG: AI-2E family transporter [Acidobacteria bacterium]|nr:AI-2E family transporter [Acidobacteriota bacterium]
MTENELSFSKKVLTVIGLVGLFGLLAVTVYYTIDVILLVFSAALIGIFLRGLAMPIGRYLKLNDVWSVLLVSALLVVVLGIAVSLLAPSVAEQAKHLRTEIPKSAQQAADFISKFSWGQAIIEQMPSSEAIMAKIEPGSLLSGVGGFFSTTIGFVGNFFIVLLLGIYFACEPRLYSDGLSKLFPKSNRERAAEVFGAIGETLRWWLIGKVASMIFIGLLTWIGLSIIGVPMALTLGLIAGLLSFIPNFGPIIAAVPAVLFAFIESPASALYTLGLYIGVQIIEGNLVTPFIERHTVELPPALTVVSQLALAVTIGGLGLLLATPLLAVLVVIVQMVYIEDILNDRTDEMVPPEIEPEQASEV